MNRLKIYISGPMTGIPEHNYPAFRAAENSLRELGCVPLNPMNNGLPRESSRSAHMCADIRMLLDADAILLLPGWMNSQGAQTEVRVASEIGVKLITIEEIKQAHA